MWIDHYAGSIFTAPDQPFFKSAASGVAQPFSVSKALARFVKYGLIYRDAEGYRFFRPFFRTWLLTPKFY
jgi:hypothetical protein